MIKWSLCAVMALAFWGYSTGNAQIVSDGGLEEGRPNPFWEESSTNFGSPICSAETCTDFFGDAYEGEWWAWFGGTPQMEIGSLSQEVTIPAGSATLSFWLDITLAGGNGEDFVAASLDGVEVFNALESDMATYHPWTQVTVDISEFADGGSHLLSFDSTTFGPQMTNFFIDAIDITAESSLPADFNGDGQVDAADLAVLLGSWGPCRDPKNCPTDLNGDGITDAADLAILLGSWG